MVNIEDLICYKNANEDQKRYAANKVFNTDVNEVYKRELEEFIYDRAEKLSVCTLCKLSYPFNIFSEFISKLPEKMSIAVFNRKELEKKYKAYLISNNYPITKKRMRKERGKETIYTSEYMKVFNDFEDWIYEKLDTREEIEKDTWDIRKIKNIKVRQNDISKTYSLDFRYIPIAFRKTVKEAIYFQLPLKSMSTLQGEIRSAKIFFGFLSQCFPTINEIGKIDRYVYEEYVKSRRTNSGVSQTVLKREISELSLLFSFIAQIFNADNLNHIFFYKDKIVVKKQLPKVYSNNEINRFNACLKDLDKQFARCLLLHELLGTRISDTLMLKKDCISDQSNEIVIYQSKTHKRYKKNISEKTKALIKASIAYTENMDVETDYIFVDEKGKLYTYAMVMYRVNKLIRENDLRMDNGEPFKFLTHQYRRTLATNMSEYGFNDRYIAAELGHSSSSSVSRYRKIRNQQLEQKSEGIRRYFDRYYDI